MVNDLLIIVVGSNDKSSMVNHMATMVYTLKKADK